MKNQRDDEDERRRATIVIFLCVLLGLAIYALTGLLTVPHRDHMALGDNTTQHLFGGNWTDIHFGLTLLSSAYWRHDTSNTSVDITVTSLVAGVFDVYLGLYPVACPATGISCENNLGCCPTAPLGAGSYCDQRPGYDVCLPCVQTGGDCSANPTQSCCGGALCDDQGLCNSTISIECADYTQPCTTTADCCQGVPWQQYCANVPYVGLVCDACPSQPGQACDTGDNCCYMGVCTGGFCPTASPTAVPTTAPTAAPTAVPTNAPTTNPTAAPSGAPTTAPTTAPTAAPSGAPTTAPTTAPTAAPSGAPTTAPTSAPSGAPTTAPTKSPTAAPSGAPTTAPTKSPTAAPSGAPTTAPTTAPTSAPSGAPTTAPTSSPTAAPTSLPCVGEPSLYARVLLRRSPDPTFYPVGEPVIPQQYSDTMMRAAFRLQTEPDDTYRFQWFSDCAYMLLAPTDIDTALLGVPIQGIQSLSSYLVATSL